MDTSVIAWQARHAINFLPVSSTRSSFSGIRSSPSGKCSRQADTESDPPDPAVALALFLLPDRILQIVPATLSEAIAAMRGIAIPVLIFMFVFVVNGKLWQGNIKLVRSDV